MEKTQALIQEQTYLSETCADHIMKVNQILKNLSAILHDIHLTVNPQALPERNPAAVVYEIQKEVKTITDKLETDNEETVKVSCIIMYSLVPLFDNSSFPQFIFDTLLHF